ncbi:MAG TPA: transporter associated domain-containing protein, partial [Candidatus Hydrogenedentes bacterium]|nr:transporter associated domain-containing protein [Candidatus Hydrogenedentota bacterium]
VGPGEWQIGGNCPLEEFEQHIGITSGDEEHTTVAGFLMSLSDKILKPGDELEYSGLHFVIREVDKKRVTRVMVLDKRHTGTENGNNS